MSLDIENDTFTSSRVTWTLLDVGCSHPAQYTFMDFQAFGVTQLVCGLLLRLNPPTCWITTNLLAIELFVWGVISAQ